MTIDSIIDNLKSSVIQKTGGKVRINEKSFLLNLVGMRSDDASHKECSFGIFQGWSLKKHRLPLTYFLCHCLTSFLLGIISIVYFIGSLIHFIITGKKRDMKISPRFNFVVFVGVIVVYIMMLISIVVFFIKSVLFFPPNNHINGSGAVVMTQPCGREQYIFLFNTATCWANTGIQVMKGDHVQITASGSFFSNIGEQCNASILNRRTRYPRTSVSRDLRRDPMATYTRALCMYSDSDAVFGSLLYQIKQDYKDFDYTSKRGTIKQLDEPNDENPVSFDVEQPGVINFAVNDMYLSDNVIDRLKRDSAYYIKELNFDSIAFQTFENIKKNNDRREMWFDDNVGEILLNVVVDRANLNSSIISESLLQHSYRFLEDITKREGFVLSLLKFLSYILVFVLLDRLILSRIVRLNKKNYRRYIAKLSMVKNRCNNKSDQTREH